MSPVIRKTTETVSASWPIRGRWPTVTEWCEIAESLKDAGIDPDQEVVVEPGGMGLNPVERTVVMVKPYTTEVTES